MPISYHFPISLERYFELGKANDFPKVDCCPLCRAKNQLLRHGFYERNAIEQEVCYRIPICRLICPDCRKTFSILPDFLLPYFQHTLEFMIRILLQIWLWGNRLCSRQLGRFYEKRCYGKLTEIEQFFRKSGYHEPFPQNHKKKAIALLQMIQALERASFVRRWWSHLVTSPLAHSLYHGSRVVTID